MRIGVKPRLAAERMLVTHGDTPQGMVESALEYPQDLRGTTTATS
jgi:hypothetical protein